LTANMLPVNPENMLPAGVKPIVELWANKDFYRGQDIESARERKLDPAERYRDNTTELAKTLSAVTPISPVQVDHLIRGYTAGLGMELVSLLNPFVTGFAPKTSGEPATPKMSQVPVARAFFQPLDARGLIDRAYEVMEDADRREATYKKLVEEGRTDEADVYLDKYVNDISLGKSADKFRQQMGKLIAYERQIRADGTMGGPEKREALDELKQLKIDTAKAYASAAF